ncbi:MAG: extracellular solute-binding protein [Cyanobacteria bacterium P01_C01_bin.120]
MDRRRLLIGLTALATLPVACQSNPDDALRLAAAKGGVSPQMLKNFKATSSNTMPVRVTTRSSLVDLFQQLQQWHQSASDSEANVSDQSIDWVALSDYWLLPAIAQKLITPLQKYDELPWDTLSPDWLTLLRRDEQGFLASSGAIWGTPYRWEHLMMVYDRRAFAQFGWKPTSWADLLRPELQQRFSLPDHPRLALGILLKALNYSANDLDPAAHADVMAAVDTLRSQVKVYATSTYLQALIIGDLALGVGWSRDIQPLLSRYRYLEAVAPLPGTLLSADVWVKPNVQPGSNDSQAVRPVEQQWLTYWWQPDVVESLWVLSQALSPRLLSPRAERTAAIVLPSAEQLQQSEFVEPLPPSAIASYEELWRQLRRGK